VQRTFIGNLVFLQALNWLIKPVWIFFIEVAVQNSLGDALYGRYYGVFALALLFNILLDFGLNNYTATTVAAHSNKPVPTGLLQLRMGLAAVYVLVTFVFGFMQNMEFRLLSLVVLNQVLAGFTLYYRAILQGRHRFKTDSIASVADRLVAAVLLLWLILGEGIHGESGLTLFLLAQTAGYAVSLLFAYFSSKSGETTTRAVDQVEGTSLLSSMKWFAMLSLCMAIFTRIDTQMLKHLAPAGETEVGQYARSFRFLDAALIFSSLISSQLLPLFSSMISRKQSTDGLIWLNVRIILFVALPLMFTGWFFAQPLLSLFYGNASHSKDAGIFAWLMGCFFPMAMIHIFGTWLTAAGKLKQLGLLALACVALNAMLNLLLIPQKGAYGAALAGCATQTVFVIVCTFWVVNSGGFEFKISRNLGTFIATVVAFALFYAVSLQMPNITGFILSCGIWAFAGALLFLPEWKKWIHRGS
jgi:O-antigen/teichoic acid export membrane protein